MKKKQIRIFLGTQEIAGMMERLNNAFHNMGIKSDFWCLTKYSLSEEKKSPRIVNRFFYHTQKRNQSETVKEKKHWDIIQMVDVLLIFIYSLICYDCYIYIFGHGLFFYNWYLRKVPEIEYKILKLCGKKMIMWFCGSDSRAPYCDVDLYNGDEKKLYETTKMRSENVKMIEKYMDTIDFAASSHFHTKPYIVYNRICVPVDENEIVSSHSKSEHHNKVVILHAPSNKQGKGTEEIRIILEELRKEGLDFEYVEISGVSHKMVLEKLVDADIVIDQLYADFPMAGFATEASANGIAVIVGGYYAKYYNSIKQNPDIPVVYCEPKEFKNKLRELICDKELRSKIGNAEKKFIAGNSKANLVAEKFLEIFNEEFPKSWLFYPQENEYTLGWGINENDVSRNVISLIENYGEESLCIYDQPKLLDRYVEMYMKGKKHE